MKKSVYNRSVLCLGQRGMLSVVLWCLMFLLGSLCISSDARASFFSGEDVAESDFFNPMIKLVYDDGAAISGSNRKTKTFKAGECKFLMAIRHCARMAAPISEKKYGDPGYDPDNLENNQAGSNYGNSTGIEGDPRMQLCLYEDPCDGGDPVNGWCAPGTSQMPFHKRTPRASVLNFVTATTMFTAVGAFGGPIAMAVGAAMGAMVAAILEHYNHVVIRHVDCVDIKIGPMPPEWCHGCWELTHYPNPSLYMAPDATFFNPKIQLDICTKAGTSDLVTCPNRVVTGGASSATAAAMAAVSSNHVDRTTIELLPNNVLAQSFAPYDYVDCTTDADGRRLCAKLTRLRPEEVCVYKTNPSTTNEKLVGCLPRPNWMPRPTVGNDLATIVDPFMNLSYDPSGETATKCTTIDTYANSASPDSAPSCQGVAAAGATQITLREQLSFYNGNASPDPMFRDHCDYLEQVEFCVYRPCRTKPSDQTVDDSQGVTWWEQGSCTDYDTKQCISGYDSPYTAVVTTSDDIVIPGAPNTNNTELGSYVYSPPYCYQRDSATGTCINYESTTQSPRINSGLACTGLLCPTVPAPYENQASGMVYEYIRNVAPFDSNATGDIFKLNEDPVDSACQLTSFNPQAGLDCRPKQRIRPLSPQELGMCVELPESNFFAMNGSSSQSVYTVPSGCGRIEVRMWAGGSRGTASGGGDSNDFSGGSGGYVRAQLTVVPGQNLTLMAGTGGQSGSPSSIKNTFGDEIKVTGGRWANPGFGVNHMGYPMKLGVGNSGGFNNRSSWTWHNGEACVEGDSAAPCYIDMQPVSVDGTDRSRLGFSGGKNGNAARGPGGGNIPEKCYSGSWNCGTIPSDLYSLTDSQRGCWDSNVRQLTRGDATSAIPNEPDLGLGTSNNAGASTNALFPMRWPGAGGCSYDNPNHEPWKYGSNGRIELQCIGGTGLSGEQDACAADNVRAVYFNTISQNQEYYDCTLPQTGHGNFALPGSCVLDNTSSPTPAPEATMRTGTNPQCSHGTWIY